MDLDNFNNQGWPSPKPSLTEPGVKYFLNETLKQCHIVKNKFHNTVINIGLLIGFLLVLGLKNLQEAKRRAHQELITGLPNWENDYDNINKGKIY
jgi:hypothetical protein